MKKMRIGIPLIQNELNGQSGWIAGFYFVKNCLNALAELPTEFLPEIFVFVSDKFCEPLLLPKYENKADWLRIIKIPSEQLNDIKYATLVEELIQGYECDLFFPFSTIPDFNFRGRALGWIPDYQDRYLRQYFSIQELRYRKFLCDVIVGYSNKILCSSNAVYTNFKEFYPTASEKAVVIHFRSIIPDEYLAVDPKDVLEKFDIKSKYVYMPNQFWIHKNHKLVFQAWKLLKDIGLNYSLVCTGSSEDYRFPGYYQELQDYLAKNDLDNIKILGFLTREEQIQLYRGASLILQPSLFEGWSTSLEDAKALGKRVLVSDTPIHREQCDKVALFFDKNDPQALANILQKEWDGLPLGFDRASEIEGRERYVANIKLFAQELLAAFQASLNDENIKYNFCQKLLLDSLIEQKRQLQEKNIEINNLKTVCNEREQLIVELSNNSFLRKLREKIFS